MTPTEFQAQHPQVITEIHEGTRDGSPTLEFVGPGHLVRVGMRIDWRTLEPASRVQVLYGPMLDSLKRDIAKGFDWIGGVGQDGVRCRSVRWTGTLDHARLIAASLATELTVEAKVGVGADRLILRCKDDFPALPGDYILDYGDRGVMACAAWRHSTTFKPDASEAPCPIS